MTGSGPEDLFGESMYEVHQCVDQVESLRESVHSYAVAEATCIANIGFPPGYIFGVPGVN